MESSLVNFVTTKATGSFSGHLPSQSNECRTESEKKEWQRPASHMADRLLQSLEAVPSNCPIHVVEQAEPRSVHFPQGAHTITFSCARSILLKDAFWVFLYRFLDKHITMKAKPTVSSSSTTIPVHYYSHASIESDKCTFHFIRFPFFAPKSLLENIRLQ
jgi:hypothetical protein